MPETDELSFRKGDHFILLNDLQNGWFVIIIHYFISVYVLTQLFSINMY
jgi:hypothetical protein